jgi:hypothetical protein
MMYKRQEMHADLCVLRVNPGVLDLEGVVVTDFNAAVSYARFAPAPSGLSIVDRELVFAEWWTHDDPIEKSRRRAAKCAEVLIPDRVAPSFISGMYVSCPASLARVRELGVGFPVVMNRWLFFR